MRASLAILAIMLPLAGPVSAQDFLKPLGEFLDEVLPTPAPQRSAPRTPNPPAPPATTAAEELETPPPMPRPRPEGLGEEPIGETDTTGADAAEDDAPDIAPVAEHTDREPSLPQSDRIYQTACPALISGRVIGKMSPPIDEGICGERSPLVITAVQVNGRAVPFSTPVTTNCAMAEALADWVGEIDAYASAALDSPVAQLDTGTSMMCRARNGGDDEFISEHGFANALDVVGMTLEDGRVVRVETDWLPASGPAADLLRYAHGAACGRFTTVLGPEANAAHADHLHVDLGCHGQSCTAQICE